MSTLSILCPVDFSESSRAALRYALAIVSHCGAKRGACTRPKRTDRFEIEHLEKSYMKDAPKVAGFLYRAWRSALPRARFEPVPCRQKGQQ